jgi:hypothetical protein
MPAGRVGVCGGLARRLLVTEPSAYEFSRLRDGPFTLLRGHGEGLSPILLVAPAGDYPSRESLQRLEHEYALRAETLEDRGDVASLPTRRNTLYRSAKKIGSSRDVRVAHVRRGRRLTSAWVRGPATPDSPMRGSEMRER